MFSFVMFSLFIFSPFVFLSCSFSCFKRPENKAIEKKKKEKNPLKLLIFLCFLKE